MSFPRYEEYKDSGVDWLGLLPSHWETLPNKVAFSRVQTEVGDAWIHTQLLSLTLRGVVDRDIDSGDGKYPADFCNYQLVEPKDLVMCLFDMDETPRTVGLSENRGMITSAYDVFRCTPKVDPAYVCYYYLHVDSYKGLRPFYTGLRKTVRTPTFLSIKMPIPPLREQHAIASFLDRETSKIDALVSEQRRLVELLKEKRQAVISHAVTKGLDPTVPMKPSGIPWLGDVPAHWGIVALKHIVDLKSGAGITAERIEATGDYPVFGGNGLRGFTDDYTHDGHFVIIGRQGALCGNVNYGSGKFWASEHAVVATPTRDLDTIWLGEMTRAMNLNQYSETAAQPGLSMVAVGNLRSVLPPVDEQKTIARFVIGQAAQFDALSAEANRAITLLQERRTALISAAVTGKIDVRDLNRQSSTSSN
jgi:type I restriction enzyme S subunit